MNEPRITRPPVKAPEPAKPQLPHNLPCMVTVQPDGCVSVTFLVDQVTAERLRKRAYTMPLERYLYENIIKPSIMGAAY